MNIIEHYIVKIHSETASTISDYIIVDLTYNCYGGIERKTIAFHVLEWKKAKEKGYFLA